MTSSEQWLIGISIALLGSLVVTVWRGGRLVQSLVSALAELKTAIAEMKISLVDLHKIPMIEQRVAQLEDIVSKQHSSKISVLWDKIMSLNTHVAVIQERTGSRPNFDPNDPDKKD